MSDEAKKPPQEEVLDDELAELLTSALQDFDKVPKLLEQQNKSEKSEKQAEDADKQVEAIAKNPEPEAEEWSEDFIRQAAAQFESNLSNLLGTNQDGTQLTTEQIQAKFQQLAEAAQQVVEHPEVDENSSNFAATISQTVQGINESSANLQNPMNEQDILSMFTGQGDQNAILPFMQGMMQSLLSKDVLYPSLKDILDKFPDWLQQNKEKISKEEYDKYNSQKKLMEDVCKELEQEKESDTVQEKQQRFDRVLSLMQKLQDYGQPPADLVGDVGPGLPDFGADPSQCAMM